MTTDERIDQLAAAVEKLARAVGVSLAEPRQEKEPTVIVTPIAASELPFLEQVTPEQRRMREADLENLTARNARSRDKRSERGALEQREADNEADA